MWGITLDDCLRYKQSGITTCEELKGLTVAGAKAIYLALYWNTNLGLLSDVRVDTKLFDCIVNLGPFSAILFQRAANQCGAKIKTDGILGPITVGAINSLDPTVYLDELVQQLLGYYDRIVARRPSQVVFINGWHARARRLPV